MTSAPARRRPARSDRHEAAEVEGAPGSSRAVGRRVAEGAGGRRQTARRDVQAGEHVRPRGLRHEQDLPPARDARLGGRRAGLPDRRESRPGERLDGRRPSLAPDRRHLREHKARLQGLRCDPQRRDQRRVQGLQVAGRVRARNDRDPAARPAQGARRRADQRARADARPAWLWRAHRAAAVGPRHRGRGRKPVHRGADRRGDRDRGRADRGGAGDQEHHHAH